VKVLITGATGFVGRHLIAHLKGKARTAGLTLFGTCFPEHPEHCASFFEPGSGLALRRLDLRSAAETEAFIRDVKPDRIFHLAALTQVRLSWEHREETLATNVMGTFHLFEAARKHAPQARILFVSSSDVYGLDPRPARRRREEDRNGAVSPYAFSKISGELLSEFYAAREKLAVVIARPFPHTGPGQSADFVCSDWARQIALIEKGAQPASIQVGSLALRRDYADVRDVVRAYDLLMKKGKAGEAYNVCSGRVRTLREILGILLSFSPRRIGVRVDRARIRRVDIPVLAGSNARLRGRTGWVPGIPLEKTLLDLLEDWRRSV
jgi:GDP-4-dehydro-6-deoxy-D-mannose reductase